MDKPAAARSAPAWLVYLITFLIFFGSGVALAQERYLILRSCYALGHEEDCTDPEVTADTAGFEAILTMVGGPLEITFTPILASVSDHMKARHPDDVTARFPFVIYYQVLNLISLSAWTLHSYFWWPRWVFGVMTAIYSSTGGMIFTMALLQSVLSDLTPPGQRARPFLLIELFVFLGSTSSTLITGAILGETSDVQEQLVRQRTVFVLNSLLMLPSIAVLLVSRWYFKRQRLQDGAAPNKEVGAPLTMASFRAVFVERAVALQGALRGSALILPLLSSYYLAVGFQGGEDHIVPLWLTQEGWSGQAIANLAASTQVSSLLQILLVVALLKCIGRPLIAVGLVASLAVGAPMIMLTSMEHAWAFMAYPLSMSAISPLFATMRAVMSDLVPPDMVALMISAMNVFQKVANTLLQTFFLAMYRFASPWMVFVGLSLFASTSISCCFFAAGAGGGVAGGPHERPGASVTAKQGDGALSGYYDSDRDEDPSCGTRPRGGYALAVPMHLPVMPKRAALFGQGSESKVPLL